jgi:hypothetical protein
LKNVLTPAVFLFAGAAFLSLQSCNKTEIVKDQPSVPLTTSNKSTAGGGGGNSGGGGGNSGGGHNGGGGGTATPPPAPIDTVTSQLPVGEIITVGKWKVYSFVQGNDNNTLDFANYSFTFSSDGTMIADDGTSQTTGIWHYQDAIFYYGIPVYGSSPYGFTMTIGTGLPLTLLNENYFISKKTLGTLYIDSINPNENAHIIMVKL